MLVEQYGDSISELHVMSHAQYPAVFKEYMDHRVKYGDVSMLDTRTFLTGIAVGEEVKIDLEHGKELFTKVLSVSGADEDGIKTVTFELNGQKRNVRVQDKHAESASVVREKSNPAVAGSVGAPMPGVVIDLKVKEGDTVDQGDPLVVLSAMKMETVVSAPVAGKVLQLTVAQNDALKPGDLIVLIDAAEDEQLAA